VAALVTLPEATGDLLEDGAGASPDLERVMATTQAKAGKTVRNKSGQRKKKNAKKREKRNKSKLQSARRQPSRKNRRKRRSKPSKDQGYRGAVADRCFATVELSKVQRSTTSAIRTDFQNTK
jgi:hypothetical protein